MALSKLKPPTGVPIEISRTVQAIYDHINGIIEAVNQNSDRTSPKDTEGKIGDIRLVKTGDSAYQIQGRFKEGWASTSKESLQLLQREGATTRSANIVDQTGAVIAKNVLEHPVLDTSGFGGGGGGGEANTASNLGGGLANFDSKSGVDLRFNTFKTTDFDLTSNVISIDQTFAPTWTGKHIFNHSPVAAEFGIPPNHVPFVSLYDQVARSTSTIDEMGVRVGASVVFSQDILSYSGMVITPPNLSGSAPTKGLGDVASLRITGNPVVGTNAAANSSYAFRNDGDSFFAGVVVFQAGIGVGTIAVHPLDIVDGRTLTVPDPTIQVSGNPLLSANLATQFVTYLRILMFADDGGSRVITDGATLAIEGAPVGDGASSVTNPYALWVQADTSRFDGDIAHLGANLGFFSHAVSPQQVSGGNLTNNVTSGGTTDTIANYTSLSVYATDAVAIRNNIYQLARKLKQVNDALRLYGLLT